MNPLHILLTNDDGFYATGLQLLHRALYEDEAGYRISVVAPDRERSAVGHGITMHKPLRVDKINMIHNQNLEGLAVNGTPSDCVKLAVEALLEQKPDLVVSGINRGSNLGTDVIYSGTVSAAVEGLLMEIPSIAVSLTGDGDNTAFSYAADFICRIIPVLREAALPSSTLININVPNAVDQINGARVTRLGHRRYRNAFEKRIDPRGNLYYWLAGELVEDDPEEEDCDTRAIREGYISVTPVHFNLTNDRAIPDLKKIIGNVSL